MFRTLFLISLIFGMVVVLAIAVVPASGVSIYNQTIPTRTPRPPTDNDDDDDDDDDPAPTSISTEQATSIPTEQETLVFTPTSTVLFVTLAPIPEGGFLSTAEPCDANPTVKTLGQTNVRAGPGTEYESIAMLVFLEVRPIIGRAEFSDWWLAELADGSLGWVSDQVVIVQGYIGYVPIVEAPALGNESPTPGPAWDPTPIPTCTPPPSPTPTLTNEPSRTPQLSPTASATSQPTVLPSETRTLTPTKTNTPTITKTIEPELDTATPMPIITSSPPATLENSEANEFNTSWILFAGLGLVIIGGIWFLLQRRGGQ